jgi:PAS domain S-box-containing protein
MLDVRTLIVVHSVVAITTALSLVWVLRLERARGAGLWALSLVLTAAATAMIAAGNPQGSLALAVTPTAFIGLSYGLRYYALCMFFEARRRPALLWGPVALEVLLVAALLASHPTIAVGLVDLTRFAQSLLLLWVLVRHGSVRTSRAQGLMLVGLVVFAAVFLPRGAAGLVDPVLLGPAFATTLVQSGTWLASFLGSIIASFALVLMYRERATLEVAQQKEALARSEARLFRVLSGSTDGFGDFEAATGCVSISQRYCEIYGLPAGTKEISAEALMAFVEPADRPPIQADMAEIRDGVKDAHLWEYPIRRADGTRRWIQSRGRVVGRDASGSPVHVSGAITDITERKQAEEARAASERRYRSLIDLSPSAILTVRDGHVEIVNRALLEATGYDRPEELVGRPVMDLLTQDTQDRSRERMATLLAGGQIGVAELRVVRKDGSIRLMESAAALSPDERGPVIQVALRDITEQRAMQAQLQVASRLAALGTLVAGVAHEINNPLAGEMASQEFALREVAEAGSLLRSDEPFDRKDLAQRLNEVDSALQDARSGSQRIARIVKDLATFGRPNPRRERVRLGDAVEEAMRWLPGVMAGSATIQVENREAPDVVASTGQMGQVLLNLITNAVKAIPDERRGIIGIQVGPGRPGTSCVEVTDNGCGMAPEVLARIFDPFFTTREVGQGTGLGLSISHAIVSAHGGTITATSEVGKGSTFRVELPAAPVEA